MLILDALFLSAVLEVNASAATTRVSYNVFGLRNEVLLSTAFFGYRHSFRYFMPVDFCGISLKQVKTHYSNLKLVFCITPDTDRSR